MSQSVQKASRSKDPIETFKAGFVKAQKEGKFIQIGQFTDLQSVKRTPVSLTGFKAKWLPSKSQRPSKTGKAPVSRYDEEYVYCHALLLAGKASNIVNYLMNLNRLPNFLGGGLSQDSGFPFHGNHDDVLNWITSNSFTIHYVNGTLGVGLSTDGITDQGFLAAKQAFVSAYNAAKARATRVGGKATVYALSQLMNLYQQLHPKGGRGKTTVTTSKSGSGSKVTASKPLSSKVESLKGKGLEEVYDISSYSLNGKATKNTKFDSSNTKTSKVRLGSDHPLNRLIMTRGKTDAINGARKALTELGYSSSDVDRVIQSVGATSNSAPISIVSPGRVAAPIQMRPASPRVASPIRSNINALPPSTFSLGAPNMPTGLGSGRSLPNFMSAQ